MNRGSLDQEICNFLGIEVTGFVPDLMSRNGMSNLVHPHQTLTSLVVQRRHAVWAGGLYKYLVPLEILSTWSGTSRSLKTTRSRTDSNPFTLLTCYTVVVNKVNHSLRYADLSSRLTPQESSTECDLTGFP